MPIIPPDPDDYAIWLMLVLPISIGLLALYVSS